MSIDYSGFPTYPIIPLPPSFRDARGAIQNLFTDGMQSGALITSEKGSRRADHYHKTGNHLCVLLSGELVYKWRPVGSAYEPSVVLVSAKDGPAAFYTPPLIEHSMEFTEDSAFLSFDSKVPRHHGGYEADLVRLEKPLV